MKTIILILFFSISTLAEVQPAFSPDDYDREEVQELINKSSVLYQAEKAIERHGQEQEERFGIITEVRLRVRYEEKPGKEAATWLQERAQIKGYVNITKDGCLKAKFQAATGEKYSGFWGDTGIGQSPKDKRNDQFSVRHFYIDKKFCDIGNLHIMAGALPTTKDGYLGFKASGGWVDGSRITYETDDGKYEITATVGRVSDFNDPSVFDRDWDGDQFWGDSSEGKFKELTLKTKLHENVNFFVSLAEHTDNFYLRGMVQLDVSDMQISIDQVDAELLSIEGELYGGILVIRKKINNKWKMSYGYTRISTEFPGKPGTEIIPIESFYGNKTDSEEDKWANNFFIITERKLGKSCSVFGEFRDGDSGPLYRVGGKCKTDVLGRLANRVFGPN